MLCVGGVVPHPALATKTVWVTSSTANALTPTAIALGNFDGVHRGHRQVIQPTLEWVATQSTPTPAHATVVTFNPHPREYFTGRSRQLLTPLEEKVTLLEDLGITQLVLLPFDSELAALSPSEFVAKILVEQLQATFVSIGDNFRFGRDRAGSAEDLQRIGSKFGVKVNRVGLAAQAGNHISSSRIRAALANGKVPEANALLGRPYTLTGIVVTGQRRGRTLGFPTANLEVPVNKLLPRQGVYYVRVTSPAFAPPTEPIDGVMNLGLRPTIDGTTPTIEIHLLDWAGDLYGQTLTVSLYRFLRAERKFPSLDALRSQITADCEVARRYAEQKTENLNFRPNSGQFP